MGEIKPATRRGVGVIESEDDKADPDDVKPPLALASGGVKMTSTEEDRWENALHIQHILSFDYIFTKINFKIFCEMLSIWLMNVIRAHLWTLIYFAKKMFVIPIVQVLGSR